MSLLPKGALSIEELSICIGHHNRELLEMALLRTPGANGQSVALAVLALLLPNRNNEQLSDATKLVDELTTQSRLGGSSLRGHDATGHHRSDSMERADIYWVGVAVLAAVLCGAAAFWLRGQKRSGDGHWPAGATETPLPLAPKPVAATRDTRETVRFAAAVLSGKARETGTEAERASDLFSMAMFWWTGTSCEWDQTVRSVGLSPLHTLPESDDVLLVSVYETALPRSAIPTTRFESSAILRDAARGRKLRHVETYGIPIGTKLTQSGFTR